MLTVQLFCDASEVLEGELENWAGVEVCVDVKGTASGGFPFEEQSEDLKYSVRKLVFKAELQVLCKHEEKHGREHK